MYSRFKTLLYKPWSRVRISPATHATVIIRSLCYHWYGSTPQVNTWILLDLTTPAFCFISCSRGTHTHSTLCRSSLFVIYRSDCCHFTHIKIFLYRGMRLLLLFWYSTNDKASKWNMAYYKNHPWLACTYCMGGSNLHWYIVKLCW